uniref:hypothetical protein n=1 Tax=Cephaleuros parasiticus TaxID=173370 RepID=UPI001EDE2452|nr:hypothetical protein MFQ79_pgp049 [Cephaleuros parasiticus]UIB39013.1 hypothetical protein [Cephaleuros parasiticus]
MAKFFFLYIYIFLRSSEADFFVFGARLRWLYKSFGRKKELADFFSLFFFQRFFSHPSPWRNRFFSEGKKKWLKKNGSKEKKKKMKGKGLHPFPTYPGRPGYSLRCFAREKDYILSRRTPELAVIYLYRGRSPSFGKNNFKQGTKQRNGSAKGLDFILKLIANKF